MVYRLQRMTYGIDMTLEGNVKVTICLMACNFKSSIMITYGV